MESCIFCKIIDKEKPSDIIYENDEVIVIKDANPKTPVHLLIIPKKHIPSVNHIEVKDKALMGNLILTAKKIAKEKNLKGYKLLINVGREGGQIIDHIHLHLFGGRPIEIP